MDSDSHQCSLQWDLIQGHLGKTVYCLVASSDRKDVNLELLVPVSLQQPQVSRRLEVTERHPDIVRISDSCHHVTCGQVSGVRNIPSLLTPCGMFCNRRTHQRPQLSSLVSHPSSTSQPVRRLFLNGEQELSVGSQVQDPGFCPQSKVREARDFSGSFRMLLGHLCDSTPS